MVYVKLAYLIEISDASYYDDFPRFCHLPRKGRNQLWEK